MGDDLGWMDSTTAPENSPAKRMAVKSNSDKQQQLNLLILSLQSAQAARQLTGAVFWTALIPAELGKDALKTTRGHAERTKGQSGHKFGSPHVQLWRTFLKTLLGAISGKAEIEEECKTLKSYLSSMEEAGVAMGHKFVSQARLKVVRDPEKMIVFYSLSTLLDPQIRCKMDNALHKVIVNLKGEIKPGTAPPSDAEKKIQSQVDELREELGIKK